MPRHRPQVLARTLAAAGLALLAGACSDQPFDASPGRSPAGAALSTANPAEPPLIANTVKYAQRGAKPATGRSGSASLTARALIGKDGQTLLEVTTGALDTPAPAPGTLAKLQVKQFTPKDEALRTLNYNNLPGGGSAAYSYGGLVRGAKLQVQANVRGIDPRRTDVVTVAETVHLRPDLRTALHAPAGARPGVPVNISAVVSEENGDVGARANCVLYVDGVEADRANGIWVDAGDAVTCAFTHVFQTSGTRQLRVEVADVAPGDFEPANNGADGTIRIAERFAYYYAYIWDNAYRTRYHTVSRWTGASGWNSEYVDDYENVQRSQGGSLFAELRGRVSFPLTGLVVSQSTGGAPVHSAAFTQLAGDDMGLSGVSQSCVSRRIANGGAVYVCTGPDWYNFTWVNHYRFAGLITYQSSGYSRQWDSRSGAAYVYFHNYGGESSRAGDSLTTVGPDYTFSVELTDGDRTYSIEQTVVMDAPVHRTTPLYLHNGESCWRSSYPEGVSEGCTFAELQMTLRSGQSWGTPD